MDIPSCPKCRAGAPDIAWTGTDGRIDIWQCTACGHEWEAPIPQDTRSC